MKCAGLGLLGLGATLIENPCNHVQISHTSKEKQEQLVQKPKTSSLEELAREGLPQEFKKMGFKVGDYVNRNSDKEIIILAENHITADIEAQAKFIKYLTNKHGIDSLGIESCTGISPNINFPVPSKKHGGFSWKLEDTPEEKIEKIERYFSKYNVNIPIYGIEDSSLLKLVNALSLNRNSKKQELSRVLSKLKLPEGFNEADLKFNKDGTLDWGDANTRYWYSARSKAFAKEIKNYMELKSRTGAIIVGTLHADVPYELGYSKEMKTIQNHLPYSYLVVHCGPGADPREKRISQR